MVVPLVVERYFSTLAGGTWNRTKSSSFRCCADIDEARLNSRSEFGAALGPTGAGQLLRLPVGE